MYQPECERSRAEEARVRALERVKRFNREKRKEENRRRQRAKQLAKGSAPKIPPKRYVKQVSRRIKATRAKMENDWNSKLNQLVAQQENSIQSLHLCHLFGLDTGLYAYDTEAIQNDEAWNSGTGNDARRQSKKGALHNNQHGL